MDPLRPLRRLDRYQQHHPPLAVLFATVKKFSEDRAGNLAALLGYYGFLSVFPLLLVFITVLGYVLAGDQSLMDSVRRSVLGDFPVIGSSLRTGKLHGSVPALAVGVVLSLLSGLGVTSSAQNALNRIWEVTRERRPDFLMSRLRGVALLVILGVTFIVASAASALVSGGLGDAGDFVLGVLVSLVLNFGLLIFSFKLLCSAELTWRSLVPGAAIGAVLSSVLQLLGGRYVAHISHSSSAYGVFALVIGVILWLHLAAQLTLYCAELNVVVARRRWPRSLFGAAGQVVPRRDGLDEGELERARQISVV